jgi:C-terminal processing protease CtpA/Prc
MLYLVKQNILLESAFMRRLLALFLCLLVVVLPVFAIGENPTPTPSTPQIGMLAPATLLNDEGGAVNITGSVAYTNAFFTAGVSEPMVILEDQSGFIARDRAYVIPVASQQIGQITSDFFTSPFTYTLSLPQVPQAATHDFNGDGGGVMVFAVAYWKNIWGDAFLQERDLFGGGWSSAYASTLVSSDALTRGEYIGGKVLVYAPQVNQEFPIGFGVDGLLFTADDPLVLLPQGYTLVDMSTAVFTFDRSRNPIVDLLEGEGAEADNFSELNYLDAFDAMLNKFRTEYAFTEFKNIDWDALSSEYRPRFEAITEANVFALALFDFIQNIPDGHVAMSWTPATYEGFITAIDGGIGIAIREVDDGRTIVSFVTPDSPADLAGIELGAEIISFNDMAVAEVISNSFAWSGPFSTEHFSRLQQLRYATRFPVGESVSVVYKNPDDGAPRLAIVQAVQESDSFDASSFNRGRNPVALPIDYQLLPSGYMLVSINSFFDDARLTISLWERMLREAKEQEVKGIIIDMRRNGGGSGFLADQMAAYFFEEPFELGNSGRYDETLGEFYFDEASTERFILPSEDLRWDGNVAVLISPNCLSACEFFSYNMTINDRADIIGQYPTGGLGGGVEAFFMPDNIQMQMTISRAVDMNGEIHIEGQGVAPTVLVPVTPETLFSTGDPILETAIAHLDRLSE